MGQVARLEAVEVVVGVEVGARAITKARNIVTAALMVGQGVVGGLGEAAVEVAVAAQPVGALLGFMLTTLQPQCTAARQLQGGGAMVVQAAQGVMGGPAGRGGVVQLQKKQQLEAAMPRKRALTHPLGQYIRVSSRAEMAARVAMGVQVGAVEMVELGKGATALA